MQSILSSVGGQAYRKGKLIVVPRGAELPPYCVKCGAPASGEGKKSSFSWHSKAMYLLILLSPVIYIIVALIVRKKAELVMPLCEAHRQLRRKLFWVGLGLLVGSIPASVLFEDVLGVSTGWSVLLMIVMVLAGLIVISPARAFLRPVYIDETRAEFEGVSESVLARLPSTPAGDLKNAA